MSQDINAGSFPKWANEIFDGISPVFMHGEHVFYVFVFECERYTMQIQKTDDGLKILDIMDEHGFTHQRISDYVISQYVIGSVPFAKVPRCLAGGGYGYLPSGDTGLAGGNRELL